MLPTRHPGETVSGTGGGREVWLREMVAPVAEVTPDNVSSV